MIIDCHGHYTTAPDALGQYRERQKAKLRNDPLSREMRKMDRYFVRKTLRNRVRGSAFRIPEFRNKAELNGSSWNAKSEIHFIESARWSRMISRIVSSSLAARRPSASARNGRAGMSPQGIPFPKLPAGAPNWWVPA